MLNLNQCENINKRENSKTQWVVQVLNQDNFPLPIPVEIKVALLTTPPVYREYLYKNHPKPTQPLYSEEEYHRYFPQFTLIEDEQNRSKWQEKELILKEKRICTPDSLIVLDVKSWPLGLYRVTVTATDKIGREIYEERYFTLQDSGYVTSTEPLSISVQKKIAAGEKIPITLSSVLQDAKVTCLVFQGKRKIYHKIIELNTLKTLYISTKRHLPYVYTISLQTTQNGETYHEQICNNLTIPKDCKIPAIRYLLKNKQDTKLSLKLTHWNRLLEPESANQWEVEITDANSLPHPETELLAFMYDYSLNTLSNIPPTWGNFFSRKKRWYKHYFYHTQNNQLYFENLSQYEQSEEIQNKPLKYNKKQPFFYPITRYDKFNGIKYNRGFNNSDFEYDLLALDNALFPPMRHCENVEITLVDGIRNLQLNGIASTAETVRRVPGRSITLDEITFTDIEDPREEASAEANDDFIFSKDIQLRSNFTETAFFYPQLRTDKYGKIKIDFTIPDQYTRWHFLGFAHDKNLHVGTLSSFVQTQRSLMIQTNCPRFVREGDTMRFMTKIANLRDTLISGYAGIELFDYQNNKTLSMLCYPEDSLSAFTCPPKGSTVVSWEVVIPQGVEILGYRVLAQSGLYGDGEEKALPVLSNRALVNESLHFTVPAGHNKSFLFQKLKQQTSSTLQSYSYTMEVTGNPFWYAIQSLPYLMTYRYDCNEQLFSKLYANTIAHYLLQQNPEIERQYAEWHVDTTNQSLQSPLMQKEELKNVLLEESPWYYAALGENDRKQQMSELFNSNRINREIDVIFKKLQQNQNSDGGWSWFGKGDYSAYITQHIVAGFYKLEEIGIKFPQASKMISKAVRKMDSVQSERYQLFLKDEKKDKQFYINELDIQYLYVRTLGTIDSIWLAQPFVQFYLKEAQKGIDYANLTRQAEYAMIMQRIGKTEIARERMEIIRQQATSHDDEGLFWRDPTQPRYFYYAWYEAPIERQALLIEAFSKISHNQQEIKAMKQWLLAQKHTHYWSNTKATTAAVYALLLNGSLSDFPTKEVSIRVGNDTFYPASDPDAAAGTNYLTKIWKDRNITSDLANIQVQASATQPVFGSCYWQYFENMDKVTSANEGLSIERFLFREIPSTESFLLDSITVQKPIQLGEKIIVRMVIRCDRDLEYIHIKDLRAAAFEPTDVKDDYVWQNGLRYFQCPRDASMNFFINRLGKGTYIIEYPLIATQTGEFSNGFASIECMYAPEFRAQSGGFRIKISPLK